MLAIDKRSCLFAQKLFHKRSFLTLVLENVIKPFYSLLPIHPNKLERLCLAGLTNIWQGHKHLLGTKTVDHLLGESQIEILCSIVTSKQCYLTFLFITDPLRK